MALGEREQRWLRLMREVGREWSLQSGWGTREDRRWFIEHVNEGRIANGIRPLDPDDDPDYPPELEFYERARALGML